MEAIPQLELPSPEPRRKTLIMFEVALIGKFTGLWPGPSAMDSRVVEHWSPNIHSPIYQFASGRCYFVFIFLVEEDCNIRFLNPIWWDPSLSPWTLDFNPQEEISSAWHAMGDFLSLAWVRLPHLPLIFWDKSSLRDGNKMSRIKKKSLILRAYVCGNL